MKGEAYVEYLLKSYHQIKREIESEKALMNLLIIESEEDIIEELNFKGFRGEKVKENRISDKTGNIAIRSIAAKNNQEFLGVKELQRKIRSKEMELQKLEAAVGILEEKEQKLIRGLYFEKKSRYELCRELYISEVTLGRWKKKAVNGLGKWWG